ncbi:DUF4190 domain-containing protein [Streptacidiphilus monticola]
MKKTSAAAVTSLVAAVLALVPVGVVLGIVALFRIPRRDQRGKRLAVVALSVCAGWTLVAMVAVIGAAAYVGTRHGLITAMRTGVCYNEPDNATGQVDVVGCAGQHDGQIVARPQLDGGHGGYPGDGATMRRSVVDCARAVAAAVPDPGRSPRTSSSTPTRRPGTTGAMASATASACWPTPPGSRGAATPAASPATPPRSWRCCGRRRSRCCCTARSPRCRRRSGRPGWPWPRNWSRWTAPRRPSWTG